MSQLAVRENAISKFIQSIVLGLFALLISIPYAFRDPEPHHDGIQYAAALGVSQGLEIQSEIFSQYGPVTAWLQGFTLWLFGPELIWIRLLNAVLIVGIALFMQVILRRTIHNFVVPFLIPMAWVASNPDWSVGNGVFQFWPWPSVLFEFLAISALYLWIRSTECKPGRSNLYLFAAGLVVGISGFTRSQNGFLLYLALASAMTVISYRLPNWKKQVLYFSAGTFVSGVTIILYFVLKGSLDDFINQAIIGSASNYAGKLYDLRTLWDFYYIPALLYAFFGFFIYKVFASPTRKVKIMFSSLGFFYFLLIFVISMNGISIQESEHEFLKRLALALETNPIFISTFSAVATAFVPILLLVAYTSFGKTKSVESTKFLGLHKRNTVKAFSIWITLITGLLLITDILDPIRFSSLVLLVIPFAFFAFHFRARDALGTNSFPISTDSKVDMALPVVASFVALASISQIFPVHDPYHLWWAAPIPIVSAILCSQFLTNLGVIESKKGISGTLVVLAILSIVSGLFHWRHEIAEPKERIDSGSLRHMYVSVGLKNSNDETLRLLDSVKNQSATFYCRDGLVATWTSRFMSSGPDFVDWAWGTKNSVEDSERFFLCIYQSMESGQIWADENGFEFRNGVQLDFSYFSSFYLVEVVKKE